MKKNKIEKITQSGVGATIIFVMSQVVKIPLPFGYANMGDCFVIMSGWYIGGVYGCLASIIGSVLADAISGYIIYIPASIIIKALMSFASYKGYQFIKHFPARKKCFGIVLISIIVEIFMVGGYFLYEIVIYGYGAAILSFPGNVLQGVIAIITSTVFSNLKIGQLK